MRDKLEDEVTKIIEERDSFHQVIHELVGKLRELTEENKVLKSQLCTSDDSKETKPEAE